MQSGLGQGVAFAVLFGFGLVACAKQQDTTQNPRYTIIRGSDSSPAQGGLSPEKQSEIQLLLQQREPTARKCYQEELNVRQDRSFQGSVEVLITLKPQKAPAVRVLKSTLNSPAVEQCLVRKLQEFDFPAVDHVGEVPHTYMFRPAY